MLAIAVRLPSRSYSLTAPPSSVKLAYQARGGSGHGLRYTPSGRPSQRRRSAGERTVSYVPSGITDAPCAGPDRRTQGFAVQMTVSPHEPPVMSLSRRAVPSKDHLALRVLIRTRSRRVEYTPLYPTPQGADWLSMRW